MRLLYDSSLFPNPSTIILLLLYILNIECGGGAFSLFIFLRTSVGPLFYLRYLDNLGSTNYFDSILSTVIDFDD